MTTFSIVALGRFLTIWKSFLVGFEKTSANLERVHESKGDKGSKPKWPRASILGEILRPLDGSLPMTNIYSSDGLVTAALLVICTCAYLKRIPRLNAWLFADKHGALYKVTG